jgi:hypothetical protein
MKDFIMHYIRITQEQFKKHQDFLFDLVRDYKTLEIKLVEGKSLHMISNELFERFIYPVLSSKRLSMQPIGKREINLSDDLDKKDKRK